MTTIYNYQNNWECLNCGENEVFTMVAIRISDYYMNLDSKLDTEEKIIYRPKYSVSPIILESGEKGLCYCSYRCFMNPNSRRAKL